MRVLAPFELSPLLITAVGCFFVFLAACAVLKSEWRFNLTHSITTLLVLIAMAFFVRIRISVHAEQNALLAAIFATLADLFAYIPSVVNARKNPDNQSVRNLLLNGIKSMPAFSPSRPSASRLCVHRHNWNREISFTRGDCRGGRQRLGSVFISSDGPLICLRVNCPM